MNSTKAYEAFKAACRGLGAQTNQSVINKLILGFVMEEVINDLLVHAPERLTTRMIAAINRGYSGNLATNAQAMLDRLMKHNPLTANQVDAMFTEAMCAEYDIDADQDADFDGPGIIDDDRIDVDEWHPDLQVYALGPDSSDFDPNNWGFPEDF